MKNLLNTLTAIGLLVFGFQVMSIILVVNRAQGSMVLGYAAIMICVPFALVSFVMVVVLMANRGLFDRPWRQILQVGWVLIALAQIILLSKG